MWIRRLLVIAAALALAVWWRSDSRTASKNDPLEVATGVVRDIGAIGGGGIRWHVAAMPNETNTQSGVAVYNIQAAPAQVSNTHIVTVETPNWALVFDLTRITEVVCMERFIHEPAPGFMLRYFSFNKGPDDEDGFPDQMFEVYLADEREQDFENVCNKYALRRRR
ncbi:MAG: hypothetical protein M4D80_31515 [Myxococcota bacterium]|nr:hypothetical protein [Myxococcota bacterium]